MTEIVRLPLTASDAEILQVVRDWCARLAAEDYEGALSMVRHDDWTPQMLRDCISTYAGWHKVSEGEPGCRVTPLVAGCNAPSGEQYHNEVWHPSEGSIVPRQVLFDLPINGAWSTLTAMFEVIEEGGKLVLHFEEAHVM